MITFLFGLTTMCACISPEGSACISHSSSDAYRVLLSGSTFASSVFSPAFKYISVDYDVSTEVVTLGVSLFVAGYIFGPLIWAVGLPSLETRVGASLLTCSASQPLSELYGRRPAVIYPMIVFVAFTAGTATATNIQTIMITSAFSFNS